MNKEMILEKVELVRTNINRIVCNSQNWDMKVANLLYYWKDHLDKNKKTFPPIPNDADEDDVDVFYNYWMNKLMHCLEKYDFVYIDDETKNDLLAIGRACDNRPIGIDATTDECIMNLIKNFSDNLIIQYCVFLLLKKQYNIERAKTSTMNGILLGL